MSRRAFLRLVAGIVSGTLLAASGAVAETSFPFEGTWVRADRACTPTAASRTYTAKTLVTPGGHCAIRKIAMGSGEFEIFEDCHRVERAGNVVEKIKMLGADAMVLKFQSNRLKIPRGRRFLRCTIAVQKPPLAPPPGRASSPASVPKLPAPPPGQDSE